jgi:malate dehydrogenase (oxaloacetate-decarboxylating)
MSQDKNTPSMDYLINPLLNKGTSFTYEERTKLGLHGLIPPQISTIEQQVERRYRNFLQTPSDIGKYIFLKNLQNRNEVLFYRLALEHAEEMLPYIYTPTVGDASLEYSNIYSDVRGLYISYELKDQMDAMIVNYPYQDIEAIVVTDGSRILGLGDVGIGGMTIPIGKLSLYTLFGGIHPSKTLPIILDVGTDNAQLLADPLYLGSKHARITGKDYDDFVDAFVKAIKKRFPKVLLQWEDFSKNHARPLLEKYRKQICSFNDDIQGTAAVALAGILSALKACKKDLKDQKIAILGGGSAGLGIADYILQSLLDQGLSQEEAYQRFYIVDIHGLLHTGQTITDPNQKRYAQQQEKLKGWKVNNFQNISLLEVVENAHPSILLGVSAQPKVFTQQIVETMSKHCDRPIIFPLSNPTSKAEADPKDLITWSKGKAIVATGSPSRTVEYEDKHYPIAQCNNVYIFPGVGLGIIASKTKEVDDKMFLIAAQILAEHAPLLKDPNQSLFPSLKNLRSVARLVGIEIVKYAFSKGLAQVSKEDPVKIVDKNIWFPDYQSYV